MTIRHLQFVMRTELIGKGATTAMTVYIAQNSDYAELGNSRILRPRDPTGTRRNWKVLREAEVSLS
jgi:hypothetical protein